MSAFKPGFGDNIHVEHHDDGVNVHFGEDTVGFNQTSDGISVTPDWNNRHFTLAFGEDSILYHITREDLDDRRSGKSLRRDEFVEEMYGYVRSVAWGIPFEKLDVEMVGKLDMDEMRDYLEENGAISDTNSGMRVDDESTSELIENIQNDPAELGRVLRRVLDPVSVEEARDGGEHIFLYPNPFNLYVLVFYPDDYVGITTLQEITSFWEFAGGSQLMDHVIRTISLD